jgi:hypothetical protein
MDVCVGIDLYTGLNSTGADLGKRYHILSTLGLASGISASQARRSQKVVDWLRYSGRLFSHEQVPRGSGSRNIFYDRTGRPGYGWLAGDVAADPGLPALPA